MTMNGYNFTERVRKALQMAREASQRLHHEYVGTEHILLGLIREGGGVAIAALQALDVDLKKVEALVEQTVKPGKAAETGPDLPYTSRAKKVLELSMSAAREFNHTYVGTEHLLIGLMREQKGIAAQVLADSGVTQDALERETLRLLGTEHPPREDTLSRSTPRAPAGQSGTRTSPTVTITIEHADGRIEGRRFTSLSVALSYLRALGELES